MYVVLLTGGLASGKDTVSSFLAKKGAVIIDTDKIAKDLQEEEILLTQLKDEFGADIINAEGLLDRQVLAERAFSDQEAQSKLNAICWSPVKERVANYILSNSCLPIGKSDLLVVQIPLLAEAPEFLDLADEVIAVTATQEKRLERAKQRGMNPKDAARRIELQASDEDRAQIANTIFDNNGSIDLLEDQIQAWYLNRVESRMH